MSESSDITARRGRRLSRRAALTGLGASVAGLVGVAGVDARGQRQRPKYRKVTKTFRQFTPITVPEQGFATPYPSIVRVSGFKASARITDLTVTLHLVNVRFLDDLDILLQAPSGERCVVVSDAGNTADAGITLVFDDAASQVIGPDDEGVGGGRYRPVNHEGNTDFGDPEPAVLARFKGLKPNGNWRLYVYDDTFDGSGAIEGGWSLRITVKERR